MKKVFADVDINILKSRLIEQTQEDVVRCITDDLNDSDITCSIYFVDEEPERQFTIMYLGDEYHESMWSALVGTIQESINSYVY